MIDVQLGGLGNVDGLVLLEEARAGGVDVPAIILSGHLDFDSTLRAREHGAVAISKAGLLADKLQAVLEDPFAKREAGDAEDMTLEDLAVRIRRLGKPLAESMRDLRRLAMMGEIEDQDGNISAVSRATGYTRTHVGRFKPR